MGWYALSKCVSQIKVEMNHGQVGARMVKWRRNEGMLNGKWPHAKWQSALSAFCLFYTHSSITNISLQRTSSGACVCARVLAVTCFSDHKTQKAFVCQKKQLFCSADGAGDPETCNLKNRLYFLSQTHKHTCEDVPVTMSSKCVYANVCL